MAGQNFLTVLKIEHPTKSKLNQSVRIYPWHAKNTLFIAWTFNSHIHVIIALWFYLHMIRCSIYKNSALYTYSSAMLFLSLH